MEAQDDPVEKEINVYLTKNLSKNLYILQYPVRPSYMTYDNVELLSGKVKPTQNKLELEVALNTGSKHYSKSKGEQFALNVDGRDPEQGASFYGSNRMDKQVLSSHPAGVQTGRYAVGYYKSGELYLSPIHTQVQMRPSFSYLDKSDSRVDAKLAAQENGDSSQDEAEEEVRAVTVKFSRPESDAAKARRLASFSHKQKMQDEEQWIPLEYHNTYSQTSDRDLQQLYVDAKEPSTEFHVEAGDYLKMLMSQENQIHSEKPAMPSNVLSLTQLKSMPLADQVKALLTNAKVIRFNQLLHLLPQGTDQQATLRALQIVAVMVQGCWVVKSEVLYPKDGCSPNSGISSDLLCRGRDFVMWRFTQSRFVTRKEIAAIVKLPSEDVKDILEQMSHIRFNQGWEFIFPHDYEFTDRFPEVIERQVMLWDCKYKSLSKQLNISEAQEKKIRELAAAEALAEQPRRRRTSSRTRKRTLSGRSISDHSDMETDVSDIDNILAHQGKSRTHEQSDNKNDNSVFNGATMEITGEPDINGANGGEGGRDFHATLEEFIKDFFFTRYVVSMSELTHLLNVKLAEGPPGHPLATGVTEKDCEQTVINIGGIALKSKWQNEAIFLHVKTEDDTEPLRLAIVDILQQKPKFVRSTFNNKVKSMNIEASESVMRTVLRDYCVNRSGSWVVKCMADTP
ncbi:DNA-directed RNA polymerase III subunit RPC5-like [Mya arenaria]|uniref:DNA-directed RNA polymerase III subunit RPC5-like n=1 Tax=Mya arenaria TaxID=6604 RepID=UPI0022E8A8FD|nr:DNA-directed RNA polymerase III subunit RPC5-like [Mya arenaria]